MTTDLTFNLADLWEAVVDRVAEREAFVCGSQRRTYAELEERSNRLAHALLQRGISPGDHVGLHLRNGSEYLEGMLAAFKIRAVPINVNHRYVADELRHLYRDSEVVAVVVHHEFLDRAREVQGECPELRLLIGVDDDTGAVSADEGLERYEDVLASSSPDRSFGPRSGDDRYIIYTGGTTGLPKGVVWRQEDAFFACIGGGDPMRLMGPVTEPHEVLDRIIDGTFVFFPLAPLMHAAAQWTSFSWFLAGGKVVLWPGSLDPLAVWETVRDEGVNALVFVGDAVARPMLDAWDASGGLELPSLLSLSNGGAPLTPALKDRISRSFPAVALVDGFGSSETGAQGAQRLAAGDTTGGVTRFTPYGETTAVLDEATLARVAPGSGVVGRVALRGRLPLGYHNDPDKTAATFVEVDGERWVLTGDMAVVEDDGSITLLGRGSGCINTGGEKVFPEEVEAVLKAHPGVYDSVVVGVDDPRWGQAVTAVVQSVDPDDPLSDLDRHCRAHLAGYKVPKRIVRVDTIERSPAGKADYRWAARVAAPADRVEA